MCGRVSTSKQMRLPIAFWQWLEYISSDYSFCFKSVLSLGHNLLVLVYIRAFQNCPRNLPGLCDAFRKHIAGSLQSKVYSNKTAVIHLEKFLKCLFQQVKNLNIRTRTGNQQIVNIEYDDDHIIRNMLHVQAWMVRRILTTQLGNQKTFNANMPLFWNLLQYNQGFMQFADMIRSCGVTETFQLLHEDFLFELSIKKKSCHPSDDTEDCGE